MIAPFTGVPPFTGGRRAVAISGIAGLVGLALTVVGALVHGDGGRRALFSYLVAFTFWIGIAISALILLGSFHASSAKWPVVMRRFIENLGRSLPIFAVLFLPIAFGYRVLFPWAHPGALPAELRASVAHKALYLNPTGFFGRAVIYFVLWIVVGELLRAWSVRQDAEGGVALTVMQRRLGAGALPLLALTMTFASFDWLLALDAKFSSTIFGAYWFGGSFMAVFAVIILAATWTRADRSLFGAWLSLDHFHSLGKFLLAFVAFWAYMAFSQFLLVWIANIPDEVPWLVVRIRGTWAGVFGFLVIGHFLFPFFALLSRDLKRNPVALSAIAAWCLLAQYVDVYWLVMPQLHPLGPRPSWIDLAALVGVGGVAIAFTVVRMRGAATVPLRDPYLESSLKYEPV